MGDLVWVFCQVLPKGGTNKLLKEWRGPYRISEVFQEGRFYVLSSGQKVHFEQLTRHVNNPSEWKANVEEHEIDIIVDLYPDDINEEIDSDIDELSFVEEGHQDFKRCQGRCKWQCCA